MFRGNITQVFFTFGVLQPFVLIFVMEGEVSIIFAIITSGTRL